MDPQTTAKVGTPTGYGVIVQPSAAPSAVISRVAASASNVTLFAANNKRSFFIIVNDSPTAWLYIKYGPVASLTDYSIAIPPVKNFMSETMWKGQIDGIWDSAAGAAQLTEG